MKLSAFSAELDKRIPKKYSCEWDNDGLMCATDMNGEVKKVLCTLDVTADALKYAADNGFDTVLSHHPLIFHPLTSVTPENHIAKKVLFAAEHRINVLSFHTRFDAMPGGMNDLLCDRLSLKSVVALYDDGDIGRIGALEKPCGVYDFCNSIKRILGTEAVLLAKSAPLVNKIAVVGGDGKDFVVAAKEQGADTFVSGRIGYNMMAEAEEMGITLIEAGHFFTENIICSYFSELMQELGLHSECFNSNIIELV